jgi:hypothetical protein
MRRRTVLVFPAALAASPAGPVIDGDGAFGLIRHDGPYAKRTSNAKSRCLDRDLAPRQT